MFTRALVFWAGLACATSVAQAQTRILPDPVQVSPHAWAWIGPYDPPNAANRGFRMNLGFVVGRDAVAVIDTGYTQVMAEEMVAAIRRITPLPVRYAINTNSQPHRFMGNDVMHRQGAQVIAARETVARIEKEGGDFVRAMQMALQLAAPPALPGAQARLVEPKTATRIGLGGDVTIEIVHVGRTHTGGSLVVRVLPDRTVYAGDVLYAGRLLAILPDSSISGWIAGYEALGKLDAALFVPGHGPPAPLAAFEQPTLAYLKALKTHMDAAFKAGAGPSEAVRSFDASRWKHLAVFNDLSDRNGSLAYLESERDGF